jgi:hypothetical protein
MELDEEYDELNTRIKIRGLGNVKYDQIFSSNLNSV